MLDNIQSLNLGLSVPNRGASAQSQPRVINRSGLQEFFDVSKITQSVAIACEGLAVDPHRIVAKTVTALSDGFSTRELDQLVMRSAASFIVDDPQYSKVAARLLAAFIDKEVTAQDVHSFSQAMRLGFVQGLINERVMSLVVAHEQQLDSAIATQRTAAFDYYGLHTLHQHYLLKHPKTGQVIETPQYLWMRMAVALSVSLDDALVLYKHFSLLDYLPSASTLQSAGTAHEQLSSCILLDPTERLMDSMMDSQEQIADASKAFGDIGVAWHGVRNALQTTDNQTDQIAAMPWLQKLDAAIKEDVQQDSAMHATVFMEPWHVDIESFLAPTSHSASTHTDATQSHHMNLAHWVCDLFMRRVEANEFWSLFDPSDVPELAELFGEQFDAAYVAAEARGLARKVVPAAELFAHMMHNIAHSGNGWITFKDKANRACNQTGIPGNMVHLSGPCSEIVEVTKHGETAICNLGTINLSRHVKDGGFDFQKLAQTVKLAIRQLDHALDLNTYPVAAARDSSLHWRPLGLGAMGLQDVFFKLRLPFDGYEARELSTLIAETIYYHALKASMEAAREFGAHEGFADTRAAHGELQFEAWGVTPSSAFRWDELRADIKTHGLRNSLLIAIAPTTSLAAIAGCIECIEPQLTNVLHRPVANGDYLEINPYLVAELQALDLWNADMRRAIVEADGSVQGLYQIPEQTRTLFRTAWELSTLALIDLAADRGAYVDQSQSLKLFVADPNVRQLSRIYLYAWRSGLKTTYLVRSRWAKDDAGHASEAVECMPAQNRVQSQYIEGA